MNMDLSPYHALVCGGGKGIGKAAAIELAGLGAEISLLGRTLEDLQDTKEKIISQYPEIKVHILQLDLNDMNEISAKLIAHLSSHGPIQILINNSGGPPAGPLIEASPEEMVKAFKRLVAAPQLILKALLPGMKDSNYGRIINVISTSVREPIPNLGVSNTIRGATASWAKSLSNELPPGITINNILPGFTQTHRLDALKDGLSKKQGISIDKVEEQWKSVIPEKRFANPEETAQAIAFLASPAASYIRGVSLPVDGGRLKSI